MNAKDLKKTLHIMAWIIIWILGFVVFFTLLSLLEYPEGMMASISFVAVGAIIVLVLFSLEVIVDLLDTIATNSTKTLEIQEKLQKERLASENLPQDS